MRAATDGDHGTAAAAAEIYNGKFLIKIFDNFMNNFFAVQQLSPLSNLNGYSIFSISSRHTKTKKQGIRYNK